MSFAFVTILFNGKKATDFAGIASMFGIVVLAAWVTDFPTRCGQSSVLAVEEILAKDVDHHPRSRRGIHVGRFLITAQETHAHIPQHGIADRLGLLVLEHAQ